MWLELFTAEKNIDFQKIGASEKSITQYQTSITYQIHKYKLEAESRTNIWISNQSRESNVCPSYPRTKVIVQHLHYNRRKNIWYMRTNINYLKKIAVLCIDNIKYQLNIAEATLCKQSNVCLPELQIFFLKNLFFFRIIKETTFSLWDNL